MSAIGYGPDGQKVKFSLIAKDKKYQNDPEVKKYLKTIEKEMAKELARLYKP